VPRVASETNVLPPVQNSGVRHRTGGTDSSDGASPFALLVDSADAPPAKEPRAPASRASSTETTDPSPTTPETPPNERPADAAPEPSQASIRSQATDGTEADTPDAEGVEDATTTDALALTDAAANAAVPPSVPTPPAAIVSVEVALVARGAREGSTDVTGSTAAPGDPLAKPPGPDALVRDQTSDESQPAAPEQAAPATATAANGAVPAVDDAVPAVDGQVAAEADQPTAGTQAQTQENSTPKDTGKPVTEQTAAKSFVPTESQPTGAKPNAPLAESGKRATPTAAFQDDSPKTDGEDDGAKPTDTAAPAAAAARPTAAPHRAHADASTIEDKELPPLGAETHGGTHSAKLPTEPVQAVLLAHDQAAAAVAQPASAKETWAPAIPIAGLAVEIAARAQAGQSRFEIRLDPPELGRIDVRLDIDRNGQVTSRLVVERAETLEHLQRDAASLERALQEAGLKTAQNGLQFSLRDQGSSGRDYNSPSPDAARLLVPDPDLAPVEVPANAYGRMMRTGGIDIRV